MRVGLVYPEALARSQDMSLKLILCMALMQAQCVDSVNTHPRLPCSHRAHRLDDSTKCRAPRWLSHTASARPKPPRPPVSTYVRSPRATNTGLTRSVSLGSAATTCGGGRHLAVSTPPRMWTRSPGGLVGGYASIRTCDKRAIPALAAIRVKLIRPFAKAKLKSQPCGHTCRPSASSSPLCTCSGAHQAGSRYAPPAHLCRRCRGGRVRGGLLRLGGFRVALCRGLRRRLAQRRRIRPRRCRQPGARLLGRAALHQHLAHVRACARSRVRSELG